MDKILNEIKTRHETFQSGEIAYEKKHRFDLVLLHAQLADDVAYLLTSRDELQAKLDACAEMADLWRMQANEGETTDGTEEQLAMVDELKAALNG